MTTIPEWGESVGAIRPVPVLGQHVVDRLRRLIIVGEIPAGTHLVEHQLSAMFNVSRGPVRDALKQLEAEGLVESRRRGVFATGLTRNDIDELYGLRQILEAEAVRLCMQRDALGRDHFDALVDVMRKAAEAGDATSFAAADLEFHSSFYGAANHRRLQSVWSQYRPTFADMLSLTNAEDTDLRATHHDHLSLLTLVESGDVPAALQLLHAHIEGSRQRMISAHARHHDTAATAN